MTGTVKKIEDLEPGDWFDIVPVLEAKGITPDPIYCYLYCVVEKVWSEQPGVTIVAGEDGGCWALPSDYEVSLVRCL